MSTDGQGTKWRRNITENVNRLSRVHQRYRQTDDRQTTDGHTMTYSERELEFTFAKNHCFLRQTKRHKNVTKIMSFVTLSAVSILIGIFHIGKFCF